MCVSLKNMVKDGKCGKIRYDEKRERDRDD